MSASVGNRRTVRWIVGWVLFLTCLFALPAWSQETWGGACNPTNPDKVPDICLHSPVQDGNSVRATVKLTCPYGSIAEEVEVEGYGGSRASAGGGNVLSWSFVVIEDSTDPPPAQGVRVLLQGIWANGSCSWPDGKRVETARREFCMGVRSGSTQEASPQPVIWTDTGPDGIGGGTIDLTAVAFWGPFESRIAPRLEASTRLTKHSSLHLGLAWAEEESPGGGQEGSWEGALKPSVRYFLADLSYSEDLFKTRKLESNVFFGVGWSFSTARPSTYSVDSRELSLSESEGFTGHLGLTFKAYFNDHMYWTLRPRARWFEGRSFDELEGEIAFGLGYRFGKS